ncbi:MAG: hypothetical protein JSU73_08825 [candidate division WOR-3 bacterium]|nr:MAG: hypothetical protein JSU73_08825 [candidate division WOR-3 bacterium]
MKRSSVARIVAGLAVLAVCGSGQPVVESLPDPVVHPWSFELLSNSRYSVHSWTQDTLPRQVLANVLWAMSRVPRFGEVRELYVATSDNVYLYDSGANLLQVHKPGDHRYRSTAAFEVGIACDRNEEVGLLAQAGLLAGLAFCDSASGPGVVSCPMRWAADHANANWDPDHPVELANVYGQSGFAGLTDSLVAVSSDTSLPDPHTSAPDSFEMVLLALRQDSVFREYGISLETVSQLLWAAYGPTPHRTSNGRQGLTIPSAVAGYFLAGHIYVVQDQGLDRYHPRLPGGNHTTADHRLEPVSVGDLRDNLRSASPRIPSTAPAYVVICAQDTGLYRHVQEAGLASFQLLAQARAMGLSGYLTLPLSRTEREAIALALGLPAQDIPLVVFSVGEPTTGISESERPHLVEVVSGDPVLLRGETVRVDYLLRRSGLVRVGVFDMLGRPVRRISEEYRSAGYHSTAWDGLGDLGDPVHKGSYVIGIFARGSVAQHKVTVF